MDRKVVQCKSKTLKGNQCKNRTSRTKKCWIHLGKEDNLRIKPSTIPRAGFGLFLYKKPFNCNAPLGYYTGRRTNPRKLDRIYRGATAPFAICSNQSKNAVCIDANQSTDGALHFSNDTRHKQQTNIGISPKEIEKFI